MPDAPAAKKYDVGSLLLDRPFKIRRLGHFGFDNVAMTQSLTFYTDLLGFRLSDTLDFNRVLARWFSAWRTRRGKSTKA